MGKKTHTVMLNDGENHKVQAYIQWAEHEGTYYKPKEQFDKRHKEICRQFGIGFAVVNNPTITLPDQKEQTHE